MTVCYWESRVPTFGDIEFKMIASKVHAFSHSGNIDEISIDLSTVRHTFAKGIVPLIAYCDFQRANGVEVRVDLPQLSDQREYWERVGWSQLIIGEEPPPLDVHKSYLPVQRFSTYSEQERIVNAAQEVIARQVTCEKGVLDGIMWTLQELAYNVIVHSVDGGKSPTGYFQVVGHPNTDWIELVVSDGGRGIRHSLHSYKIVNSDKDAIQLAIQQGVTRDPAAGAGNGLAGSVNITEAAAGEMKIFSGAAEVHIRGIGQLEIYDCGHVPGTTVLVELPTAKPLDLSKALFGAPPLPAFEMSYVLDDKHVLFTVMSEAEGFGTRDSGRELRTKLKNIVTEYPDSRILIDFEGLDVPSASFLDEFLGRLAIESGGFIPFSRRYGLVNTSSFVERSLEHVLKQRFEHEDGTNRTRFVTGQTEGTDASSEPQAVDPGAELVSNLERLGTLREQGVLTQEEFDHLKERLLAKL